MFLPEAFPHAQPICYVTPTSNMIIKPGHSCVDGSGLVRVPYGERWSYPRSNLTEMAGTLSEAFGAEPPLFAKPAGYVPPSPPHTSSPSTAQRPGHPPPPPGVGLNPGAANPGAARTPLYPPPPSDRPSGGLLGSQTRIQSQPPPPPPPPQPQAQVQAPQHQSQAPSSWAEYHQRPAPPPGVGEPAASSSRVVSQTRQNIQQPSPHVLAGGLSVAEGTFKARAITALSDRLRSELDVLRAQSGEEAER